MNLRQKEKPNFCALAGLIKRKKAPPKHRHDDLNSGIKASGHSSRIDQSRSILNLSRQDNGESHLESEATELSSSHQTQTPVLMTSDEKLKMPCKVHVFKCNFDKPREVCTSQVGVNNSGNNKRQRNSHVVESIRFIPRDENSNKYVTSHFSKHLSSKTTEDNSLFPTTGIQNKSVADEQPTKDPKLKLQCKVQLLKCNSDQEQTRNNQRGTSNSGNKKQHAYGVLNSNKRERSECVRCPERSESVAETNGSRITDRSVSKSILWNTAKSPIADPKFKMPCKVHVVRLRFEQNQHALHPKQVNQPLPKSSIIYKVSLKPRRWSTEQIIQQKNNFKNNGLLKYVNQSIEIDTLNEEIELTHTKQHTKIHTETKYTSLDRSNTNNSVSQAESNDGGKSTIKNYQIGVQALCRTDCDHLNNIDGKNVDIISNKKPEDDKETKIEETKKVVTRKKNMTTQKLTLKDQNKITSRKKPVKKKVAAPVATENIPEIVVEKCTDRIPVYKQLDENARNSLKLNPYEFCEIDSDTSNTKKIVKKRRRVGTRNKKQNNQKMVYDKCIKQIMNKLAIQIQSNKFVVKELKSPKTKIIFPTKNIRIQTKRPKVQFNDEIILHKSNTNIGTTTNQKATSVYKINTVVTTKENNELEDKHANKVFNTNENGKNKTDNNKVSNVHKNAVKVTNNKLLGNNDMQRKYANRKCLQRAMAPKKLFDQLHRISSTSKELKLKDSKHGLTKSAGIFNKQSSNDKPTSFRPGSVCSAASKDMFDFCEGQSDLLATSTHGLTSADIKHSTPWCISSQQKEPIAQELHDNTNGILQNEDLDMSFASQISINRSTSACSGQTSEPSRSSSVVEHISENDPYFGFDDDNCQEAQQPHDIVTNKPVPQLKKRLPALEATRKTDSPWRYSPRNISFNPHFLRINANALPVINQDPVLDCTFDENIKKQHPNLTTVECTKTPHKKSPVQKSILDYVSSNVVTSDRDKVQRVSIFNDEEFSPIKLTSNNVPKKVDANKAKRNILGALTNNIILHSVVAISTPQRDLPANQIESPNLSVIFDDLKNDHAVIKRTTTRLQSTQKGDDVIAHSLQKEDMSVKWLDKDADDMKENMEVVVARPSNMEDVFRGFSMNHIEASKNISNKLEEFVQKHEEILGEQQGQIQVNKTFFGFESINEIENTDTKAIEKLNKVQKNNQNAKPFRLSFGVRKVARKKVSPDKKADVEVPQVKKTPTSEAAVSDSDDDFIPPTPVPEGEPLKVGLFEEIESEKPKKTYRSRKRYRVLTAEDSDEEEEDRHRKKRKDQPTKKDVEEFDRWAEKFNAMCDEVDNFPLEIE